MSHWGQTGGCCKVDQKRKDKAPMLLRVGELAEWIRCGENSSLTRSHARNKRGRQRDKQNRKGESDKQARGIKLSSSNLHTFCSDWRSDLDPESLTDKPYAGAGTRKTATCSKSLKPGSVWNCLPVEHLLDGRLPRSTWRCSDLTGALVVSGPKGQRLRRNSVSLIGVFWVEMRGLPNKLSSV